VSVYATPEEVRAYVCMEAAVLLPKDDADLEAMIETAELADLSVVQVAALSRATAAAVEWRAMIGEDVLAEGEDGLEAVGSVQLGETPRPPAPKMIEELAGHGFAWRSGTVAPPPEDAAADLP
jgi:hypothetical protein